MVGRLVLLAVATLLLAGCGEQPKTLSANPSSRLAEPSPTRTAIAAAPTATVGPTPTAQPIPTPTLPPAPAGPISYQPSGRTVAVVVENEMAARPQTGLGQADVIYEAVAEWNLTRFVAVFSSTLAQVVGPVRSGRAYHAAIAAEYDAVLAQCLGVPSQSAVVNATAVDQLDGCRMLNPAGFWRDGGRLAPHNLYVNAATLRKVAGGNGAAGLLSKRQLWPLLPHRVAEVSFVYPEDHEVRWGYDDTRRQYLRWQDGAPHVGIDGEQLGASAVILQFVAVRSSSYYGEAGYHELTLVGEGQALVYAGGSKRVATWRRGSLDANTHFFEQDGTEILLPPGPVFIQLVAKGVEVVEG